MLWGLDHDGALRLEKSGFPASPARWAPDVETKVHHVAVLNDVVRSFETHAAGVLCPLLAAMCGEIGEGYRLGPYKALFEIGVDLAGRLGRLGPMLNGPGMRFLRAGGEEGDQAQKRITGANDAAETGLLKPKRRQELAPLAGIGQLRQFGFDRGRDHHRLPVTRGGIFGDA